MMQRDTNRDDQLVQRAMNALTHAGPDGGPLPDPSFLWWKAQLLRRMDAEQQAAGPIAAGDRVHVAAAVLGAVALAAGAWSQVSAHGSALTAAVVTVGAIIAASFVGALAWTDLRRH